MMCKHKKSDMHYMRRKDAYKQFPRTFLTLILSTKPNLKEEYVRPKMRKMATKDCGCNQTF